MSLSAILSAVFGCILCGAPLLGAQATPSATSAPVEERLYPEQAYLSPTRYTNQYFGFSFEFPVGNLQPIPQPVVADGRVQLLEVAGPPPDDVAISILAYPLRGRDGPDAKSLLRKGLDQELFVGVEELHGLSKTSIAGHQFYFYETRRGVDQHMRFAGNLDDYVLLVQFGAHNEKTVGELESSVRHIVFFPPAQVRQHVDGDAQAYEGPAISSHRLAQLKADPPESHIDPGKIEGGIYRNSALGLSYQIPAGWTAESEGALLPALERARQKQALDPLLGGGGAESGGPERQLMKMCSRTLFSVWAKRPGADGQIPYDDFGEVTMSAISAACFSGIRFPSDSTNTQAIKDFLLQLSLTHPILRDMKEARAFTSRGMVFLLAHGVVGFKVPNDELARRLSVAFAITERRGYLLTWFFAAPHDSELYALLEERVGFDPEPATRTAAVTKPGGGEAAAPAPSAAAAPAPASSNPQPPAAAQPVVDSAAATSANSQTGESNTTATPASAANSQSAPDNTTTQRPTLLRPGETMDDQLGNGKPLPKKK